MQDYQLLTGKEVLSINVEDISSIMDNNYHNQCSGYLFYNGPGPEHVPYECCRLKGSSMSEDLILQQIIQLGL